MLFIVYAYDQMYGGYHGIEETTVINADNWDEAEMWAADISADVIEDYCADELWTQAEEETANDGAYDLDIQIYFDELVQEDIAYTVYMVTDSNVTMEDIENDIRDGADFEELTVKYKGTYR